MSNRDDRTLLFDIHEAVKRINSYTKGMAAKEFFKDLKTQDAIIRNFEIIGEAAKNVSKTSKEKYPEDSWKDLAKFRDKLIHHYFGINIDLVWGKSSKHLCLKSLSI